MIFYNKAAAVRIIIRRVDWPELSDGQAFSAAYWPRSSSIIGFPVPAPICLGYLSNNV